MKVTTRGRVTIPKVIRERLGIYPGTDVEFRLDGDHVAVIPTGASHHTAHRLIEQMRGRGPVCMTTDEIMALTRGASDG